MSRITDMRSDPNLRALHGWLFMGAGAYCDGPTTGRTACFRLDDLPVTRPTQRQTDTHKKQKRNIHGGLKYR